jgi:hypothetical protein
MLRHYNGEEMATAAPAAARKKWLFHFNGELADSRALGTCQQQTRLQRK